MSSYAQKAGQKLFAKHIQKYAPSDPLYETYTDPKGRQKRRRRDVPLGLSMRDVQILKTVNKRAHYLDKGLSFCGIHVGWSFFVGAIPGAGDVVNAGLNYFLVVRKARQAELPNWLVMRMLLNMAVSAGIGLVPVAGDIAIAVFKTNSRNAALLEEYLRIRGEEYLKLERERMENEGGRSDTGQLPDEVVPEDLSTTGTRKRWWQHISKKNVEKMEAGAITEKSEGSATPGQITQTEA